MTKPLLAMLIVVAAMLATQARAVDIEGVKIDDKVTLVKGGPELAVSRWQLKVRAGGRNDYAAFWC